MRDRPVLFLGPTLRADRALAILPAELRPPAARGDVYRAALEEPRAILLVDGAFEDVPAVFHKEILWALKEGIHVFGAASMGALRAVELHRFGMVGIGSVFEAYRDDRVERDDAVAVLHGPAELGWPQLTRALVDIEATLAAAERDEILDQESTRALARSAESLFWRERTYDAVVEAALAEGLNLERAQRFRAWLAHHEVFQKERDCVALLEHVAAHWDLLEEPFQPEFHFQHTEVWEALQTDVEQSSFADCERQLAVLRQHHSFAGIELEALLSLLADEDLRARDGPTDPVAFARAASQFRRMHGLARAENIMRWMAETGLSHNDYATLVRDSGNIDALRHRFATRLPSAMLRIASARKLLPSVNGPSTDHHDASSSGQVSAGGTKEP